MPPFCEKHQRYEIIRQRREIGQSFTHCPICDPPARSTTENADQLRRAPP